LDYNIRDSLAPSISPDLYGWTDRGGSSSSPADDGGKIVIISARVSRTVGFRNLRTLATFIPATFIQQGLTSAAPPDPRPDVR
jgi:hypothetical protein